MTTTSRTNCPAALNILGEHFDCEIDSPHLGIAHSNAGAQAIWIDDRETIGKPASDFSEAAEATA